MERENRIREDRIGESKTGGNRIGESRTGESRTGESRTGESRTGGNRTGENRTGGNRGICFKKAAIMALALALCLASATACGRKDGGRRVVFTAGPDEDEVFLINSEACELPELMVYLTTTQNQYENVYGEEIWNASYDGVTLEENIKETVLARLAQMKTMYLLALEHDIELTKDEEAMVSEAAEEYYNSLNEKEVELMGVTVDTIKKLYREYTMAEKVYRQIIQDVNPEISDDEARTITVERIFIKTYYMDGDKKVPYSEQDRQEAYEKAQEAYGEALSGEDFENLAVKYSEEETFTLSFRKGQMEKELEDAAFALETGEISRILTTSEGYQILKCISTFNREETDSNKLLILEERKREVFGQEYDAFVKTLVRQLNETLWEKVELIHDKDVTTDDFFEVYAEKCKPL